MDDTDDDDEPRERSGSDALLELFSAVGHAQRFRILAALEPGRVHVSELARRLGLSRPLLYMHLDRLEKAGLVAGRLELSDEGRAMKYFELVPFDIHITIETIAAAVRADDASDNDTDDIDTEVQEP